ncbi:putative DNA modification/repair radical SAM protein [Candidatus Bathyarchaeota archaeon]|nr:putative DNA modification/repair radical SAM protein [Candidatus Bathyarchaeota archaeon]
MVVPVSSITTKLHVLGTSAKHDICASTSVSASAVSKRESKRNTSGNPRGNATIGYRLPAGCCHAYTSDGRCIALFKVLVSNACTNDCYYCQNATSCKGFRKVLSFHPDELVNLFMEFYKRNYVEGLFLSSGICRNVDESMHDLIEIARSLREKHHFRGYMHMKVLPGASLSDIRALGRHADRLSLNVEAAGKQHLSEICSTKDYMSDILTRLSWMHGFHRQDALPAGLTTQIIVGGNHATDHEILQETARHYRSFDLKRVYFSAFSPVTGSPLAKEPPAPLLREHRLYQADWLLRVYRFPLQDILPGKGENLSLAVDPKLRYAIDHYSERFPVDVNECNRDDLLRVPGIGPKTAKRIVTLRKHGTPVTSMSMLRSLGAVTKRAMPFIKVNGWRHARLDDWLEQHKLPGRMG